MGAVSAARPADRRGIQSVEIALRLIQALRTAGGPLLLKDLARLAQLPTSNCHRYCVSFVRAGFLKQDPRSGRYDLGPGLLQAGLTALSRLDPVAIGTEALELVVDATGYTGQLTIWADSGPTIVRWMSGRMAVHTSLSIGSTLPLLTSATGRVFLAYLPSRQTAILAGREAIAHGGDVSKLAAQVRASGVGQVSGDHIPGLTAVAAPVLDAFGEAAAVITLVAVRDGVEPKAVERLRRETREASAKLGWAPTSVAKAV